MLQFVDHVQPSENRTDSIQPSQSVRSDSGACSMKSERGRTTVSRFVTKNLAPKMLQRIWDKAEERLVLKTMNHEVISKAHLKDYLYHMNTSPAQ